MNNLMLLRQKTDLAVSDLTTGGARLPTELSLLFVRKLLAQPTILRDMRQVSMRSHTKRINKIGFSSRIMQVDPGEGTALSAGSSPALSQVNITTKKMMAEVRLAYEVIEDVIEQANIGTTNGEPLGGGQVTGQFKETILALIAERAAYDIEELVINGDTSSSDSYLAQFDGVLELASSGGHSVDVSALSTTTISREMFKKGVQGMPSQYMRRPMDMVHYVSPANEIEYRDQVASRQSVYGDSTIQGTAPLVVFGTNLKQASQMPETKGIFTYPKNMIIGFFRDIMLETDKDIQKQQYIFVLSTRLGIQLEEADAVVYYSGIEDVT
jgi:hypothetical protein